MQISRRELERYRRSVESLGKAASSSVETALRLFMEANPSATPAQVREFAIGAVRQAVAKYGDASGRQACVLFDQVMELEGVDVPSGQLYAGPNQEAIEGTVRRQVGKILGEDPDVEGFVRQLSRYAADLTRQAARETTAENARRARKTRAGRNVAFARVPTRSDPCPWCAMLASRGFIYGTSASAEAGSHSNCTCVIVPGVAGRTKVGDYDPREWERKWRESGKTRPGVSRGESGSASNWTGRWGKARLKEELSSMRESFASAESMDELERRVAAANEFLHSSGAGAAMKPAEWEALQSELNVERRRVAAVDYVMDEAARWSSPEKILRRKDVADAISCDKPVFISENPLDESRTESNRRLIENISRIEHEPNMYDVHAHGSTGTVEVFNSDVGPETFAYILRSREDYHGETIRLFSCNAGKEGGNGDCFAQRLADILGVRVDAAPATTHINSRGKFRFGNSDSHEFAHFFPREVSR